MVWIWLKYGASFLIILIDWGCFSIRRIWRLIVQERKMPFRVTNLHRVDVSDTQSFYCNTCNILGKNVRRWKGARRFQENTTPELPPAVMPIPHLESPVNEGQCKDRRHDPFSFFSYFVVDWSIKQTLSWWDINLMCYQVKCMWNYVENQRLYNVINGYKCIWHTAVMGAKMLQISELLLRIGVFSPIHDN